MIGLLSGYFRLLDDPLMRLTDIFLSLPQLPLLLVLSTLFRETLKASFGPEGGVFILMVTIIGGLQWMPTARLVRGEVLTVKSREFITAANALGAQNPRIIRYHISAECAESGDCGGDLKHRQRHHHRIGAVVSGAGLPARFPNLGPSAL